MKKHNYLLLTFLSLFCQSLLALELPAGWIQATLPEPTIFSANHYQGEKIINTVNVFTLESQLNAVSGLKKKLENKDLKNVGDGYVVESFKPFSELKNAYLIEGKNIRAGTNFTQIWKFGEKKTAVAQIGDYKKLDENLKKEILKMMEGP